MDSHLLRDLLLSPALSLGRLVRLPRQSIVVSIIEGQGIISYCIRA